jgi:hypothetical protein
MLDHTDERERGFEILFVLCLILMIAIGFAFMYEGHETHSEFCKAVGDALVIAGFLGIFIDPFVKRRLVKESIRSVDKLLIGYGLPPELQDRIKDIMRTRVVRKPMRIEHRLTPVNNKQVKVQTIVKYWLENISNEPHEFQQRIYVEKEKQPDITLLRCVLDDKTITYCLDKEKLQQEGLLIDDGIRLNGYGKKVSIQPSRGKKDRLYQFYAEYSQILPEDHTDSFNLVLPDVKTIHVIITAEYPREDFVFGTTLEKVDGTGDPDEKERWEAQRAFFPNEHITVWWQPKATAGKKK